MKTYLLVFNDDQVDRKYLQQVIGQFDEIVNWYAFFGSVMCLASEKSARVISKHLHREFPSLNLLITAVDPDQKGGWMPRAVWSFLDNPQTAEAETA